MECYAGDNDDTPYLELCGHDDHNHQFHTLVVLKLLAVLHVRMIRHSVLPEFGQQVCPYTYFYVE